MFILEIILNLPDSNLFVPFSALNCYRSREHPSEAWVAFHDVSSKRGILEERFASHISECCAEDK